MASHQFNSCSEAQSGNGGTREALTFPWQPLFIFSRNSNSFVLNRARRNSNSRPRPATRTHTHTHTHRHTHLSRQGANPPPGCGPGQGLSRASRPHPPARVPGREVPLQWRLRPTAATPTLSNPYLSPWIGYCHRYCCRSKDIRVPSSVLKILTSSELPLFAGFRGRDHVLT